MTNVTHVWRLAKRPEGNIADGDLVFKEEPAGGLEDGQFRVQTIYLSMDPTNRIWMSGRDQYMPPVGVGDPMRGILAGRVVESKNPNFQVGDIVSGVGAWADSMIANEGEFQKLDVPEGLTLEDVFGQMAVVAPTAYFGLLECAPPKKGETVVVSTAAGAVGSIVGQIAMIKGCRAVGIAGSDDKCAWVTNQLGFDACINYKTQNVEAELKKHCPDGIDVYFDNVGGDTLDTILPLMNNYGRIAQCGMISMYNTEEPLPGPYNYPMVLMRRLTIRGFVVLDFADRYPEAVADLSKWMLEGKIKYRQDIVEGLENAAKAVRMLYEGTNQGKLMVKVSDE